ncbi:ImmA/IrrE family metallo-endopeptidase [Macrococcus bovicus]|uniref:ImmA/IrrE family metallo-endopeptidase n=1 Tax=Macrococcus bovicus TaxID=69968 RepID=A0A4R6BWA7_9STAP|nr:ImmA/IrrE family metallo-endopeptidase [Macrococcus bovicus]TDM12696.1 ImmA/IrrE family metallo-endopeptidase [Macrococcus bovicus]
MQQHERLHNIVPEVKVSYLDYMPNKLAGLYLDNEICINKNQGYYRNTGTLAEEIGHYFTSHGHITDYANNINHAKQELVARRYGIKLLLPLERLIECYNLGITTEYEMVLHLEIDNKYLKDAIEDYKNKFGLWVKYEGYLIGFEPLDIKKL